MNDIVIKNLNVSFDDQGNNLYVVRDVNVTFKANTITGLIGESGSGKSVLGMSILKLLAATANVEGECYYGDTNLYELSEEDMCKIRGTEIALIPQNPTESLNPIFKIDKQLLESILIHNKETEDADKRSDSLLFKFGFSDTKRIRNSYTFQLSGGMNQRVISAMGLMNKPKWVIADEPTKGLDAILRKQVYSVLKEISETETKGMIIITHDIALAGAICDNLIVIYKGVILEQGSAKDILKNPKHPYTKGLIGSLPENGMHPIRRADADLAKECTGCSFCPRCDFAKPECLKNLPPDITLEDGRIVRCYLYA